MATISGTDKLISNLTALKDIADDPGVVGAGAQKIVDVQRRNVRAKFTKNPSGKLEAACQVIPINNKVAEAGIPTNTLPYQLVHEYGKVIVPKKKKVLRFEIPGVVPRPGDDDLGIYVKRVTIPARPFVRPSAKAGAQTLAIAAITKKLQKKIRVIAQKSA